MGLIKSVVGLRLGKAYPLSVTINMTDLCQSRCTICDIWKRDPIKQIDPNVFRKQMQESEVLKEIKLFNLAGGEPFIADVLPEIVDAVATYAKKPEIRIVTNGFATKRIEKSVRMFLEKYPSIPFGIKLSLDGMEENHNKTRGLPNAFPLVMESLDILQKLQKEFPGRMRINFGYTVTRENVGDIGEVNKLAQEKGVGFLFKPILKVKKFSAEDGYEKLYLKEEDYKTMMKFVPEVRKSLKDRPLHEQLVYRAYYNYLDEYSQKPACYMQCFAGANSFYIVPSGDVMPCLLVDWKMGNINEKPFDEIWHSASASGVRNKIQESACHCLTPCDTIPNLIANGLPFLTTNDRTEIKPDEPLLYETKNPMLKEKEHDLSAM